MRHAEYRLRLQLLSLYSEIEQLLGQPCDDDDPDFYEGPPQLPMAMQEILLADALQHVRVLRHAYREMFSLVDTTELDAELAEMLDGAGS